jgi:hypothetical protein
LLAITVLVSLVVLDADSHDRGALGEYAQWHVGLRVEIGWAYTP